MLLTKSFYTRSDVVEVAQDLLGKILITQINGIITGGIISETEAYSGRNDKACHAHLGKFTKRTEVMYEEGGCSYIYLCYGIHHLFNVVTNVKGLADAVLIRAIKPVEGIDTMLKRRNKLKLDKTLTGGPGTLTQALAITKKLYGTILTDVNGAIRIEDHGHVVKKVQKTPRIGIDYAEEDALLPWRFLASF